ncbi:hypothetical protein ATKI12_8885 [Kitasatospora sp. Ki12]
MWLPRLGDGGPMLEEVGPDGDTRSVVVPACDAGEEIGAFVVLDDGFCISWAAVPPFRRGVAPYREPRVARYARDGRCVWSSPVSLGALFHTGVAEAGVHSDWEVHSKPWTSQEAVVDHWEPLLVSGDRVAASFEDSRDGIGATFFLDLAGGGIVASTRPLPTGRKAIAGPAEFLIGSQGYGEFSTARYDRDGARVARWNSHGAMLVDASGAARGPELQNHRPSCSRFRGLTDLGTLVDGPVLTGYYTSYPALDCAGTAVFWRDGRLLAIDSSLGQQEYCATGDSRRIMSRTLLLDSGQVAFALDDELLLFQTPLGPLAAGAWPCGDGNLHGNPVRWTD